MGCLPMGVFLILCVCVCVLGVGGGGGGGGVGGVILNEKIMPSVNTICIYI